MRVIKNNGNKIMQPYHRLQNPVLASEIDSSPEIDYIAKCPFHRLPHCGHFIVPLLLAGGDIGRGEGTDEARRNTTARIAIQREAFITIASVAVKQLSNTAW